MGLEKFTVLYVTREKIQTIEDLILMNGTSIVTVTEEESYNYLGILQAANIYHMKIKENV